MESGAFIAVSSKRLKCIKRSVECGPALILPCTGPARYGVSGLCRRNSAISAWFFTHRLSRKDKTPVREAPGVCCAHGFQGWHSCQLPCQSIGPASGSRSSSAGMNRIKFVGFACTVFTVTGISALSHTPELHAV